MNTSMDQSNDASYHSSLERENERLRRTILELSILNEIATAISSALTVSEIERLIVKRIVKHVMVEEGIIMLLDATDNAGSFRTMLRTNNSVVDSLPNKLDDQLVGWMLKNKVALVVNNIEDDTRFDVGKSARMHVRSLLCVPMFVKSRMIGVLTVFNKMNGAFTDDDKRLLAICAAQSAQVIEQARLSEQEATLQKLHEEMHLAAQIQNNLLPRSMMTMNGAVIIGKTIPAKIVGGDFYDAVATGDDGVVFWLGDVSGKGMPAALLMANIQGALRSSTMMEKDIVTCISNVNASLCENSAADKFATLLYARMNMTTRRCSFVSAGQNNLLRLRKDGAMEFYQTQDIPVGIYSAYRFSEQTVELMDGDLLIVYSDGIIEAENLHEEPFGEPRLVEILKAHCQVPPEQLIEKVLSCVNSFTHNAPQSDDQTMLIMRLGTQ